METKWFHGDHNGTFRMSVERLEPRQLLSAWYDYEIVAQTGDLVGGGQALTTTMRGVSINSSGRVVFTSSNTSGNSIVIDDGASASSNIAFAPSGSRRYIAPQINDAGRVSALDVGGSGMTIFQLIRSWDSNASASHQILVNSTSQSSGGWKIPGLSYAVIANDGEMAFLGTRTSNNVPSLWINPTQSLNGQALVTGLSIASIVPESEVFPMIADGGVTVIRDGSGTGGSLKINGESVITVEPGGWSALGAAPGISDDGSVVVFSGNQGNGPGIFALVRDGGSYLGPFPIAGENASAVATAELGYDDSGTKLGINSIDYGQRVGVASYLPAQGAPGGSFVVTFVGTPNQASVTNMLRRKPCMFGACTVARRS